MGNTVNWEVLGHYSPLLLAWALAGAQPVTCLKDKASNASPGSWQGKAWEHCLGVQRELVKKRYGSTEIEKGVISKKIFLKLSQL